MGILFTICFTILAALLLPIKFCLSADNSDGLYVRASISYGWGLMSYNYYARSHNSNIAIRVTGLTVRRISLPMTDKGPGTCEKKGRLSNFQRLKKLRPYALDIVGDTLGLVARRHIIARLKLGFDDPAYTGMVAGFIACTVARFYDKVQYIPDFSGENFEIDLHISGIIIPITLLFIGLKYCRLYFADQIS